MASQDSPREGPPLIRPIPRRPFDLNLTGPTPPDDDSEPPSRMSNANSGGPINLETLNSRLLNPRENGGSGTDSTSMSRAASFMNLTGALFGIYSPTTYGKDRFNNLQDETGTPWGTGAESPVARPTAQFSTHLDLQKDKSTLLRRRRTSSMNPQQQLAPPLPANVVTFYLFMRALLLFSLGMGYGWLVKRFQDRAGKLTSASFQLLDDFNESSQPTGSVQSELGLSYLIFWGVSGVVLGALLPWFDGVWASAFGTDEEAVEEDEVSAQEGSPAEQLSPGTDWSTVVRGIGAFVGIVFAIRKLPWDSTLQVSLTLALVNPFLWYLIDRSKPGFVLSAAVGLMGSTVLLGLKPEMVPSPAVAPSLNGNATNVNSHQSGPVLGGLASQQTLETGIWMLSVLFCCCVSFGNIGRRLALSREAVQKGRWVVSK